MEIVVYCLIAFVLGFTIAWLTRKGLLILYSITKGMKAADLRNLVNCSEEEFWADMMSKDGSVRTASSEIQS